MYAAYLRAYFLVDSLLELFVVEDGADLLNIIIIITIINIIVLNTVITLPLLLLAQKGVDTSVLDSHTSVLHSHVLHVSHTRGTVARLVL